MILETDRGNERITLADYGIARGNYLRVLHSWRDPRAHDARS